MAEAWTDCLANLGASCLQSGGSWRSGVPSLYEVRDYFSEQKSYNLIFLFSAILYFISYFEFCQLSTKNYFFLIHTNSMILYFLALLGIFALFLVND